MTKYFQKSSASPTPAPAPAPQAAAPTPAPAPAPAPIPAPAPSSVLARELDFELDIFECNYETSNSDDSSYEEKATRSSERRTYGQYQRQKERQEAKEEKLDLYKSHAKALQKMLEKKVLPNDHKVVKTGRKQGALQFPSLVVFYNLMIHGNKSRIEASGLAALSLGRAQYHGG